MGAAAAGLPVCVDGPVPVRTGAVRSKEAAYRALAILLDHGLGTTLTRRYGPRRQSSQDRLGSAPVSAFQKFVPAAIPAIPAIPEPPNSGIAGIAVATLKLRYVSTRVQ